MEVWSKERTSIRWEMLQFFCVRKNGTGTKDLRKMVGNIRKDVFEQKKEKDSQHITEVGFEEK